MNIVKRHIRVLVGLVFMTSGLLKANDPLGTQYKIEDYLEAMGMAGMLPSWMILIVSVLLCYFEVAMGAALVFGIKKRVWLPLSTVFTAVMTLITIWLAIWNPIQDCGCFGEAIRLSNTASLLKNIVLLALLALMMWKGQDGKDDKLQGLRWWCFHASMLFVYALSAYSLYYLPPVDFTPYRVGVNIWKDMQIPPGAPTAKYETTFLMKKDGKTREFSLEDYPDSTWTFVDSKTEMISPGYEPPIHDLDLPEEILTYRGYTYLLIAPWLERASDDNFGKIEQLYDEAMDKGWRFICLTASNKDAIHDWQDKTGAEYPFYNVDATTLKTMVRSNPGIILLHNGVIVKKLSHNNL